VKNERFDFIIFTQVLEHLPEPGKVLAELYRVLKPCGKIFCTAPLYFPEHEIPYDFFRYTQYGLRYLFENEGYIIERIDGLEGYYGTCERQLNLMVKNLSVNPKNIGCGLFSLIISHVILLGKIIFTIYSLVFYCEAFGLIPRSLLRLNWGCGGFVPPHTQRFQGEIFNTQELAPGFFIS
jgi:SAM-dependent methyltransferase